MSLPQYPLTPPAPPVIGGSALPSWAKTFRTVLMVFHAIGLAGLAILAIAYTLPLGNGADGKMQMAWLLLLILLVFIVTSIPYLIANLVYAILWLTKLRGKGYRVSLGSALFVSIPPLVVGAAVLYWITLIYSH